MLAIRQSFVIRAATVFRLPAFFLYTKKQRTFPLEFDEFAKTIKKIDSLSLYMAAGCKSCIEANFRTRSHLHTLPLMNACCYR